MNLQTKELLKRSLKEFRDVEKHKQEKMITLVKERIKQHENALKTIGSGYADYFVEAGRIFLRIVD